MENGKIKFIDRLVAGLAYWNGLWAALLSIVYFKDRKGFTYYHCIQAAVFSIVLQFLFLAAALAVPNLYAMQLGPYPASVWAISAIFAVLFIAAVSGIRFRIPFVCNVTDWFLKWMEDSLAKAETKKKV
jgi:hypothetical protein